MILLYQVKVFEYYWTRLLALPPIEEFGHAVQVSENLAICFETSHVDQNLQGMASEAFK